MRKRGLRIRLGQKGFEVLLALLERPGEVITRHELRARLWPNARFLEFDNAINSAVHRLRDALCDPAEQARFVETLPSVGYRFIALLKSASDCRGDARREVRLLVLPLENFSGDPAQEYLSDGMTEELITQLASIDPERLRVIARTSAMHYKRTPKDTAQIARELNLDYVVEGSIRRVGDRLRISVQLIQSQGQTHLWAESYNGDAHDLLGFESEVSQAIVRQVELAVPLPGGRRPWRRETVNSEAYSDFMMGLSHLHKYNPGALHKAIAYFQAAVAKDAQYARAHAKLAQVCALAGFWGWVPGGSLLRDAEESANTALRLDEGNADAHGALGNVHWFSHWDFAAAEREFERAATLAPYDPVSRWGLFGFLGAVKEDHRRAIAEAERALELDPLSVLMRAEAGWVFYWARQFDRAIAQCRQALELDPNYPTAHWIIGLSELAKGCFDEAIVTFTNAVRRFDDHFSLAGLGMAYGSGRRREGVRQVLAELERRSRNEWVSEVYFAWLHIGAGELDEAFDWLHRACDRRNPHVLWLRVAANYDPLRRAPRYPDLLARLNLPAPAEPKLSDVGNIAGPDSISGPAPESDCAGSQARNASSR